MTIETGPARAPRPHLAMWARRSARERFLLLASAIAAAVYLVHVGAVRPLLTARSEALAAIADWDVALTQLDALPYAGMLVPSASSDQPVAALVTSTATEFGLAIRRIEPEVDGVRLAVEDAGFAEVVEWIDVLENVHGLRLVAVEMNRGLEPGVVGATLVVQR